MGQAKRPENVIAHFFPPLLPRNLIVYYCFGNSWDLLVKEAIEALSINRCPIVVVVPYKLDSQKPTCVIYITLKSSLLNLTNWTKLHLGWKAAKSIFCGSIEMLYNFPSKAHISHKISFFLPFLYPHYSSLSIATK